VAGVIHNRLRTRQMDVMSGLWTSMPRMGGVALFFALASLGLPGLANFVGEFLVLAGSYGNYPVATIVATSGFVVSTIYSLWLIHRVFYGPRQDESQVSDLNPRETLLFAAIIVLIVAIGVRPQPILNAVAPVLRPVPESAARQIDGTVETETASSNIVSGILNDTE